MDKWSTQLSKVRFRKINEGLGNFGYNVLSGSHIPQDQGVGRQRIHSEDGFGYFAINYPHQGQVTVNRTLDFEKTQRYYVTILATVSF